MTEVEAQEVVSEIVNAFPMEFARLGADQNRATQAQYRRYLLDLPIGPTRAAVERILATAKFVPKIAEIREAVQTLVVGEKRTGLEAWGDVMLAMRSVGHMGWPEFTDKATARVVAALGWRDLCLTENAVSDRARFVDAYESIVATERRAALSANLPANRALSESHARMLELEDANPPFRCQRPKPADLEQRPPMTPDESRAMWREAAAELARLSKEMA